MRRTSHASLSLSPRAGLTAEQRAHLLRRLLDERRSITLRLARFGVDVEGEPAVANRVPLHMADIGTATMQEALSAALASRDTRTLGDIDAALRRFYRDPAQFGIDERTGAPIPFERLDIIPWARHTA